MTSNGDFMDCQLNTEIVYHNKHRNQKVASNISFHSNFDNLGCIEKNDCVKNVKLRIDSCRDNYQNSLRSSSCRTNFSRLSSSKRFDGVKVANNKIIQHYNREKNFAYRPVCKANFMAMCSLIAFIFFFVFGIMLIVTDSSNIICTKEYSSDTINKGDIMGSNSKILIEVNQKDCNLDSSQSMIDVEKLAIYYEITNFNENDATFFNSRNDAQLRGEIITNRKLLSDCSPLDVFELNGVTKILHPCGAMALSVFNDTFVFYQMDPNKFTDRSINPPLILDESADAIAWNTDSKYKFKNPSQQERDKYKDEVHFWMWENDSVIRGIRDIAIGLNYQKTGIAVENPHFIVWMRQSALSPLKKSYGVLKGPLKLPVYVYIDSRYPVFRWKGKKKIIVSSYSIWGGPTYRLGILYLISSSIFLIVGLWLLHYFVRKNHFDGDIRWIRYMN